ncbi:Nitrate reductase gamma subunit [Desulfotomaculum nigrificans CO-1-SRB]|uniref:Nitrate reductase gamma subunit n=1 Tax=Desulfotomaculum nigrificans (strain DSM 14880 / VKM B-2319 / CO-1-SRB) TaxID=868595 RepID=F6B674_DESCC|nr:respiratory nitrate reductase subunit gamma [Desulfotomaculum nigrificans]AEF95497.1 Nitrate reductase gamma subunit [Desulfotomaculum nigrificans CO-1-SRB]
MTYFILQILPYIALPIFVIGLLYRLGRWANARIVHNITLTPAPTTQAGAILDIAKEVVFFRSLYKADKPLWSGAWLMHVALFFILGGHVMGIGLLGLQFYYIGLTSPELSEYLSNLLGTSFGVLLLVGLLYLLYRRMAVNEVKQISAPSDYAHLLLLIAIVSVGNFMRFVPAWGIEYAPVRDYVINLITLTPITPDMEVMHKPLFVLHLLLVQILMIIFPFSKLLHVFGMFAHRWIINRPYVEPAPGLPGAPVGGTGHAVSGGQSASGGVH